ncbi:MAG TPA: hypothetical protein VK387_03740 [Thermoleophilaceae bacterium]|nr:hypothetical protein [Thermoleophilaceae bacterium]
MRFGGSSDQTVTSEGGNPATGSAVDPITGGGDACRTVAKERAPGTAVYVGPRSGGYTLMCLPKVTADIVTHGPFGQLDSRLWDVAPNGTQRLVSRGAYRVNPDQSGARPSPEARAARERQALPAPEQPAAVHGHGPRRGRRAADARARAAVDRVRRGAPARAAPAPGPPATT